MTMRIAIGGDHHGVAFKQRISDDLLAAGHEVLDLGTNSGEAVDYPDFAEAVGCAVASGEAERGIIICGSGVGASVAANKVSGVRAAVCHDVYSAHQGVEHDDMNVLALGSRVVGIEVAAELARAFVAARFSADERHVRRLNKVLAIEARMGRSKEKIDA
jgi:RpiB/LacA/LacB family sugar-phosphate isomerase